MYKRKDVIFRKGWVIMRILTQRITQAQSGRAVRDVLKNDMKLSSGLIARLKLDDHGITVDGRRVHTDYRLSAGEVLGARIGSVGQRNCPTDFEILFEDTDILIINKRAGAAAHGSRYDDTVQSIERAVADYYGRNDMYHPVSRLDRGTTGVMLIAKNGYMHERLSQGLHTNAIVRSYLGVVKGMLDEACGTISLPIGRVEGSAIKRMVTKDGAMSVTHYAVIACSDAYSLLRFTLATGRTHQIRVHMSHMGSPLVGDWLYGVEDRSVIERPALHSERLDFVHPLTGQSLSISAPMPADIRRLTEGMVDVADFNGKP